MRAMGCNLALIWLSELEHASPAPGLARPLVWLLLALVWRLA